MAFWYLPRLRTGAPRLELSRELLADPEWSLVVWLPYPHQNLGGLERRVGDARSWLGLLAETAGRPAPRLPRFGFWSVPPAREWVVAQGRQGELRAGAAVYPTMAVLARLAGLLAGNPWLRGGEVELGGGRRGWVTWQGRNWNLTSSSTAARGGTLAAELPEALAWVRWKDPPEPLPAGTWRVHSRPGGKVVAELGEVPTPLASWPGADAAEPPAAWFATTDLGPIGGRSAFWIWSDPGVVDGLPRAAIVEPVDGRRRLRLPGSTIARLAGLEPHRSSIGGARLSAFDEASLEGAQRLQPWLEESFPEPASGRSWRGWAAGADPARIVVPLDRLSRHLSRLPLLGQAEAKRLRAAVALLAPWQGCGDLRLEVWREPASALLTLCAEDPIAVR